MAYTGIEEDRSLISHAKWNLYIPTQFGEGRKSKAVVLNNFATQDIEDMSA